MNSPEGIASGSERQDPEGLGAGERLNAYVDALGLAVEIQLRNDGLWWVRRFTDLHWTALGATEYEASTRLERMANQEEEL